MPPGGPEAGGSSLAAPQIVGLTIQACPLPFVLILCTLFSHLDKVCVAVGRPVSEPSVE